MCFAALFGNPAQDKMAKQQRADETARQARINSGMGEIDTAFAPFNDDFFAGRQKAYVDYAQPTLDRQTSDARRQLIYALSRNGNLDSSAANMKNTELDRDANEASINIANTGLDQANQARTQVEQAREGVVSQLNATGDDSAASAAALRQSQALAQPQGFGPLGQLFGNFLSGIANITSNSNNGYSGLFGPATPGYAGASGNGSQRIVRVG